MFEETEKFYLHRKNKIGEGSSGTTKSCMFCIFTLCFFFFFFPLDQIQRRWWSFVSTASLRRKKHGATAGAEESTCQWNQVSDWWFVCQPFPRNNVFDTYVRRVRQWWNQMLELPGIGQTREIICFWCC